jgi:hypothetical protein
LTGRCLRATSGQFTANSISFYGLSTLLVIQSKAAQVNLSFYHPYRALMPSFTPIFIPGLLCTELLFAKQRANLPNQGYIADTTRHEFNS